MLETKNLVKKYGGKTALNDISFPIEQGKTYLLLGPNGSGKTTWMKTAASLSKPTSGSVLWNGTPVGVESRKEISYMPTESFFYPWMIVADVGDYYADFFEDFDLDRFRDLIRDMELPADAKVKSLSSGMNAKLRLAAAISRKARVYLLDEPLNGIVQPPGRGGRILCQHSYLSSQWKAAGDRGYRRPAHPHRQIARRPLPRADAIIKKGLN